MSATERVLAILALGLAAFALLPGCTTQYDRDIADCGADKACVQETEAYYRNLYNRPVMGARSAYPTLQEALLPSPKRPVLTCYNNGGIATCY